MKGCIAEVSDNERVVSCATLVPPMVADDMIVVVLVEYCGMLTTKPTSILVKVETQIDEMLVCLDVSVICLGVSPFERLPIVKRAGL